MKKNLLNVLFFVAVSIGATAQTGFRLLNSNFGTTLRAINDKGDAVAGAAYYSYQNDAWTPKETTASELITLNNGNEVSGSMPYDTIAGTYQPAYRNAQGIWQAIGWFSATANSNDYFTTYKISQNGRFVTGQMSQNNFISSIFKYDTQAQNLQQISVPNNKDIAAYSVNDAGYTAGWYDRQILGTGTFREACYTDPSNIVHLIPTHGGAPVYSSSNDINNSNVIVGEMGDSAFVYTLATNNLKTFAPLGNYFTMSFTSVSNDGVAVGFVQKFDDFGSIVRDAVIYAPQFGASPVLLKDLLTLRNIPINTPDTLVGTAYSISPNGRFIAGWNGPYIFGYGWVIDLQEVVATTNHPIEKPLQLAPNPANRLLRLTDSRMQFPAQLEITDRIGKTVFSQNVTNIDTQIILPSLPVGIYIAHLQNTTTALTTKLMIQQ